MPETEVLTVDFRNIKDTKSIDYNHICRAAQELRTSNVPVAFPTETVYGLGADATRSAAVLGIYKAKQRPADNPLIVHVHSLAQLRSMLDPPRSSVPNAASASEPNGQGVADLSKQTIDPIPAAYRPLIERFWPGPLTLIMPNPPNSVLAPEVTAGLPTFGVRMPSNALALGLIEAADVPVAAPSANASSRPSPTEADHVKHDLDGRISIILDGGPCNVGVESTIVDGLSSPPVILRPGGIGIDELRACPGWEDVRIGYRDAQESGTKPLAPGMKYKHYSPKATVILIEHGLPQPTPDQLAERGQIVGVVRTKTWRSASDITSPNVITTEERKVMLNGNSHASGREESDTDKSPAVVKAVNIELPIDLQGTLLNVWDICLGTSSLDAARNLFSALRQLDLLGVEAIFVEGIDSDQGDIAAAVMNRLRKAAEVKLHAI